MILELVDESRLLIILSPEDMEDYQLTFDSLDWQNGHSRSVIKEFLRMACRQKGFCPGDSRLLIEAVPDEEGCVLLVTMLPAEKAKRRVYRIKENHPILTPFLFRFDQAENLLAAVDRVYRQFYLPKKASCGSRLYLLNRAYYLIIYGGKKLPCPVEILLTEYGSYIGKGQQAAAQILEHGKLLAGEDAVTTIGLQLARC